MKMYSFTCCRCGVGFLGQKRSKTRAKRSYCSKTCLTASRKEKIGYWKGKKIPFYKRPNRNVKGSLNSRWKGGKRIDKDGYVLIWSPNHPNSDFHGYVREHRLVMESKIGRILKEEEVVHHVNHNKQDNRPENLIIFASTAEHQRIHYHNGDSDHLKNYSP